MKIIELNIGLSSKSIGEINAVAVLNALVARGFTLITYRVTESTCKDGKERCLAVKVEAPQDWQSQLAGLSNALWQDCVAVVGFIGHAPYDTFCAELWKSPEPFSDEGDSVAGLHAVTHGKASEAEGFIAYLLGTLIPDLKESGLEATAEDLETLIQYYLDK